MLTCPQLRVWTSSVNEPRASTFIFKSKIAFSLGRYERKVLYRRLAKESAGISGMSSVLGMSANWWSRSTISPRVALWVTGQ